MNQERFLTKSKFKIALECLTKLYYSGKVEYANKSLDDAFLQALADGGYQVGELAKHYFPGGETVSSLDSEEALAMTNELLKREKIIIYDGAIRYKQLFIRADILVKRPNHIELVEVKAKSYNKAKHQNFTTDKGKVISEWIPYLMDVTFQKYVLQKAFPNYTVSSYLMLVDKEATCATDGLNQKLRIGKDSEGRIKVHQSLTVDDLVTPILTKLNVDHIVNDWLESDVVDGMIAGSFQRTLDLFSEANTRDDRIDAPLGTKCKSCEFKASDADLANKLKCGFSECWQRHLNWTPDQLKQPNILSLWNSKRISRFIKAGVFLLKDLTPDDLDTDGQLSSPLGQKDRQWLQVSKVKARDTIPYLDRVGLLREFETHRYPLHFIDFESCTTAIPFFKGMSPYETIAFQFSHHVLHEDGRVIHQTQFLSTDPRIFPNFDFVRTLKNALCQDNGTIFRFAAHENTVLNHIAQQLMKSTQPDREELVEFIRTITYHGEENTRSFGTRCMVDLCELVKQYYYDPSTQGSNSIKVVLPAILRSSPELQRLYGERNYGSVEFPSLNFKNHCWLSQADGQLVDPYKQLPQLFADASQHDVELLSEQSELNNGGLALTAYCKLQFTEMSDYERLSLESALLKYCELDTLAMVMIYQGWQLMLNEIVSEKN